MEDEKTESYRALYRVRPLIYHIGDIRLWVPIRQDGIVLWFVYLFLFFIFCYIIPILVWIIPLDRTVTMVIGPIFAAYYTVKLDPAGKTVPRYLQDMIHFLIRPKWFVRWQAIRQPCGKRKIHFIGRCRPYDVTRIQGGGEEWRGRFGMLRGKVKGLKTLSLPAAVQVRWNGRTDTLQIFPGHGKMKGLVTPPATLQRNVKRTVSWSSSHPVHVHVIRDQVTNIENWNIGSMVRSMPAKE